MITKLANAGVPCSIVNMVTGSFVPGSFAQPTFAQPFSPKTFSPNDSFAHAMFRPRQGRRQDFFQDGALFGARGGK